MRLTNYKRKWPAYPLLIVSFMVFFTGNLSGHAEETIYQKLNSIQLPELSFRHAPLESVLEKVREESVKNDSEGVGVNIVSFLDAETMAGPLTISLKAGSVGRAIKLICAPLHVRVVVEYGAVAIKPIKEK